MQTIAEIRRLNLALIQSKFPTAVSLAEVLEMSASQLTQLTTKDKDGKFHRNIGDKIARKLESKMNLPVGWMDTPQTSESVQNVEPAKQVKVNSPGGSAIQNAVIDTAKRLIDAGLLSDLDCLALLQTWQPLIAQLQSK